MSVVANANGIISVQANNLLSYPDLSGTIKLFDTSVIDFADIYKSQHEVRTVVDFLARNIAQIPLHVYRKENDNGRTKLDNTPLTNTIEMPDIYTTRSRWFEALVKDLCIFDEAIRVKVKSDDGRIALIRIPPNMVQALGNNWLQPEGYRIKGMNGTVDYSRDQVIHIHGYNPRDLRKGLSPLETLRQLLAEQQAAAEHREGLWRQGARASLVIERPLTAPNWSDTARGRFRADWEKSFSGSGNSGKTAVLEEGMVAKPLQTFSPRDAQYYESTQLAREIVASAYGVPAGLLMGNANYSSLTEQHRQLYMDCLAPYLTIIQEELESQLLPEFNEPNVYLEFQLQDKLKGSFEEQAAVLQASVGAPYLTRNEARARLNLPSIEGGDELVTPLNVITGGLASPQDTAPDELLTGLASNDEIVKKNIDIDIKSPAQKYRNIIKLRVTGQKELEKVIVSNYNRQRKSVLSKLGATKAFVKADIDNIYDLERFNKELSKDLNPRLRSIAKRSAETVGDWDEEFADNYIDAVSDGVSDKINKRTRERLMNSLKDIEPGDSLVDIADELFDSLGDAEIIGASLSLAGAMVNFGRHSSAESNNIPTKTWVVTSDNPRSSHLAINGETVKTNETFSNGAMWPGDPELDDEERSNCQCIIEYSSGSDE